MQQLSEDHDTGLLPGEAVILPLHAGENFSVASALVGREAGRHLMAIYGFARLVDSLGDEAAGDRGRLLDRLEDELDRTYSDVPEHPLMRRLQLSVRVCSLPREPFARLIEANRLDQRVVDYATYDELRGYCRLSADPVGELVLHVFGVATPERIALSDRVCSALQLAEHWQDVAEDAARGRIYLPRDERERFGVAPADLRAAHASPRLRDLLAFEVDRGRRLLDEGAVLVGTLRGRARLAVAGYVAGGRAAFDAIEAAGYDVLPGAPKASKRARLVRTAQAWRRGR